jgi:septal ring factor EnvC (AmiA/AmiB activator)
VAPTLRILIGTCVAAASTVAVPLLAAAQGNLNREEARKRLEWDRGRLEAAQRRSGELKADMEKIDAERERINAQVLDAAKSIQQSEARLSSIEAGLAELEAQENRILATLETKQGSISTLLGAMLRVGRNPPPVMVASRSDVLSAFRSGSLLTPVVVELGREAKKLSEQLQALAQTRTAKRVESDKLRAEVAALDDTRLRLIALQETKRQSRSERQAELAQMRKAAAEFSKSVSDLAELIAKLDKEVAEKTGLGSYEKEIAAATEQQANGKPAPAPTPPSAAPAGTPPAAAPTPGAAPDDRGGPSVVLAPPGDRVAMLTPGRIKPAIPFSEAKGLLPLPAQGRRVLTFGEKTQYGSQSKGMVLETRHGGQVVSPSDGWIVYAGDFRSYGQLLIINAGGGYHILLAGLSQIDVQLGQFVLAGEPVGVMTTAAKSSQGKAQENAPVLYIEFRKDQRPIDPDPWWVDASRKVQG